MDVKSLPRKITLLRNLYPLGCFFIERIVQKKGIRYTSIKELEVAVFKFTDENGLQVDLYFHEHEYKYEIAPEHILVVVRKGAKFLCTIHNKRGIEFPGGKVEKNETLQQAAVREVFEETGVHIENTKVIGHYIVRDIQPFCKVIFIANVENEETHFMKHETKGRVWLTEAELWKQPNLSFYMRDEGMKHIVQEVNQYE